VDTHKKNAEEQKAKGEGQGLKRKNKKAVGKQEAIRLVAGS
jgi:hypothetical protein